MRSRLLLLIAIPTLTALVLGGVGIASAVQSAFAYQRAEERAVLAFDIAQLTQRLETERDQTVYYIALGSLGRAGSLSKGASAAAGSSASERYRVIKAFYRQTDQAIAPLRAQLTQFRGAYSPAAQQEVASALTGLNDLRYLRQASTKSLLYPLAVIQKYADLIDDLIVIEDQTAQGTGDPGLSQTVGVLGFVSRMKEEASQQRAILSAALLQGRLGPAEASMLNAARANQQSREQAFDLSATAAQRAQWNNTVSGSFVNLAASQEQLAARLQAHAHSLTSDFLTAEDFYDAMSNGIAKMGSVERTLATDVIARSNSLRRSAVIYAIAVGLAVFAVLTLALMFTVTVGRSMARPLRSLRMGALEVAGVRLPETVRRMSEQGTAEATPEVEPIDVDSADEIGDVARAFDRVHSEAVRLASNEAALRGTVNAMFVNLSRRSQALVERQIRLIDDLEQGEEDSERLASLFQMDHLATRMRRNSENLLVLAGHDVTRRWTQAVALVDVLRAALSEIEQYERVTLDVQPSISVRGNAVSDVVHLLSELLENAASFSAADTPVHLAGHLLTGGGALIAISDQGVGMNSLEMAHANWRLDSPPVMDVAVSRRMGLFVVARLAARHGIRVRLRPAAMNGLTALVWLPDEVISHETAVSSARPHRSGAPRPAAPGVPSMEPGLAGLPTIGQPDERSATVEALPAALAPGLKPARQELGATAAFPVIGSSAGAAVAQEEVSPAPGALSGDDDVDAPDAQAPASGMLDAGSLLSPDQQAQPPPGLGAALISSIATAGTGRGFTPGADDSGMPSAGSESGPAQQTVTGQSAANAGEENRLPIFEAVESDWFRRGRHDVAGWAPAQTQGADGWTSPADEGWHAAQAANAPVSGEMTGAGLPKRVPKANLIPGGVGISSASAPAPPMPSRSPAAARDRLASFQRGIREGRALTPGMRGTLGPQDEQ